MFDLEENKKLAALAKKAEWYETPVWAAERVLDVELLTPLVVDPCAGRGVLGNALIAKGYDPQNIIETDLNEWPGQESRVIAPIDFLGAGYHQRILPMIAGERRDFSVMMNPPFSHATEFVERSLAMGARKILMFQRFSFLESSARRDFWDKYPPARIWLCGDRANCWRGDVPDEDILDEGGEIITKGKKGRSTPTAHAWFVWERDQPGSMTVCRLYKE